MNLPKIGDEIYMPNSWYLTHGRDDIDGGKAIISEVCINEELPDNHFNKIFVKLKGMPVSNWNYKFLLSEQEQLKMSFGDQVASPNPDNSIETNPPNYGW